MHISFDISLFLYLDIFHFCFSSFQLVFSLLHVSLFFIILSSNLIVFATSALCKYFLFSGFVLSSVVFVGFGIFHSDYNHYCILYYISLFPYLDIFHFHFSSFQLVFSFLHICFFFHNPIF